MSFPKSTAGQYEGTLPENLLDHIVDHVADYGVPLERDGHQLRISHARAEIRIEALDGVLRIGIGAAGAVDLYHARESTMFLLDHVCPEAGAGIAWSGEAWTAHPPSFHLATLHSRERVGASFLRLTMACPGVEALSTGGMHFSLLLPPEGRPPVWPSLDGRGRTCWPEGDDALHRAAYTFVSLDAKAGSFSFDLFLHEGSRASAWAEAAPIGATAGIMGPGGGDLPEAAHVLLAGDETALPAIRRILELSSPDRRGRVLIETGDAADRCPLALPAGMDLTWLSRRAGETLLDALRSLDFDNREPPPYLWIAAEQATVRAARAHFGRDPRVKGMRPYFSAYWRRNPSATDPRPA
ncbi:siderophore-interacting protein [Rhodobacter sp. NSM]|uniref:siderophore-interacting protein n=1 Tax=Rhodobacter sp. NSM TaxID=3457501 RepID=UPI003FD30065